MLWFFFTFTKSSQYFKTKPWDCKSMLRSAIQNFFPSQSLLMASNCCLGIDMSELCEMCLSCSSLSLHCPKVPLNTLRVRVTSENETAYVLCVASYESASVLTFPYAEETLSQKAVMTPPRLDVMTRHRFIFLGTRSEHSPCRCHHLSCGFCLLSLQTK